MLLGAASSRGTITVKITTNESGTEPPDHFEFHLTAQHAVTREEERGFVMEVSQYRDGEMVELVLTGFVKMEEGSEYVITASCSNDFGTSEDSDSLSVEVQFSTGNILVLLFHTLACSTLF